MSEDAGRIADDERDLLARAGAWPDHPTWADLTGPVLARLAAGQGLDFATALLYDRLRRSERHGLFIRRVDELIARPPDAPGKIDILLALAPGAFYREMPGTGADGWLLRQRAAACGCRTAVIPTHSCGSVADNGRVIRDWLAAHAGERIILASLSKGAADVKAALAAPGAVAAFRPVAAWLNLSGMPDGIPLANWLLERPLARALYRFLFWWKGMDFAVVRQLRWGPGSVLDFPLVVPPGLQVISVVGFPLERHLTSKVMRRCHRRTAPLGPNDGLVLLAGACALPGLVYPVWGADHNLRPASDVRRLVTAMTYYLADTLDLWASPAAAPQETHVPGG